MTAQQRKKRKEKERKARQKAAEKEKKDKEDKGIDPNAEDRLKDKDPSGKEVWARDPAAELEAWVKPTLAVMGQLDAQTLASLATALFCLDKVILPLTLTLLLPHN